MKRIVDGLNILMTYSYPGGDFAAGHDIIYAGKDASDMDISEEDLKKLDELGWFIDEEYNSWAHFC